MYLIILVSNLYLWIKVHRWLPSCPWLLNGNLGQQGSWLQRSLRCFISFSPLGGSKVKVEASCCSWWGRHETVYIAVLLWFLHHRVHPFSIFSLFVSHLLSRVDLGRPVPWFSIWSIKDLFLIGQWIIYKDETFGVKQLLIKIAAGQTKGQQFLYLSYVFTFYCFLHIVLVSTPIMSSLHVTLVSHVQICMEHLKYPHQLCYGWLLSFFWQQHETYNL